MIYIQNYFTLFCVENAQMTTLPFLIYTYEVGVNEERCKILTFLYFLSC